MAGCLKAAVDRKGLVGHRSHCCILAGSSRLVILMRHGNALRWRCRSKTRSSTTTSCKGKEEDD